jgi:hypothetical protein
VADFLKSESEIEARIDPSGKIGEFTVWVDDKLVIKKNFLKFPDKKKILAAVQQEM